MATGLLIICIGSATRLSEYLMKRNKEYLAIVALGETTDTYDAAGNTVKSCIPDIPASIPADILDQFRGTIQQEPPAFSAIKRNGQPVYRLARRGKPVKLDSRPVNIEKLTMVNYQPPCLTLKIVCSSGTYIRSLAHDLGKALGCGAHLAHLTRTRSGDFNLANAHSPHTLEAAFTAGRGQEYLLPPDAGIRDWPSISLEQENTHRILHGVPVPMHDSLITGLGRAYGPSGELIAIVEADPASGNWNPRKVLVAS